MNDWPRSVKTFTRALDLAVNEALSTKEGRQLRGTGGL